MDVQTHISWPVCGTCSGTGQVPKSGGTDDGRCGVCKGAGRLKPEGWQAPIWSPFGLVDAGSDPELQEAVAKGRIALVKPDAPSASLSALEARIAELEKKAS